MTERVAGVHGSPVPIYRMFAVVTHAVRRVRRMLSATMAFLLALGGLSLLLASGLALRVAVPALARLLLPVSLMP